MESRFFPPRTFVPVPPPARAFTRESLATAAVDPRSVLHDPPLEPRDETVFLLTAAAEIEHALMVQYLFAAYSLQVTDSTSELARIQDLLLQIAREEMGHFITVQNLLHLVGGPLNMGRERAPYGSEIYPFRFTLEPVTLDSLAKYVTAESPLELPETMPEADQDLIEQLRNDATAANGGTPVNHVGPIFERLAVLIGDPNAGMADADFRTDTAGVQGVAEDWGLAPPWSDERGELIVREFSGTDVAPLREAALAAVKAIADQGEGFDETTEGTSHFERFFAVYKSVANLLEQNVEVSQPVATNPSTAPGDGAGGQITEPRAKRWAQLFDLRYRMLLGRLAHFLRVDQERYTTAAGPQQGDRTARGLLLLGAFDEMRHLKKIAGKLVQLPKDPGGSVNAGPPFELPYSLSVPDGETARWRMHLDVSRAATRLVEKILESEQDPFLSALLTSDEHAQAAMAALAAGDEIPAGSLPAGFAKAVTILEEAVRGFSIGCRHAKFWAGKNRDEFVTAPVHTDAGDVPPFLLDDNGAVVPNSLDAPLLRRLRPTNPPDEQMPLGRPAVPRARQAYLREWVRAGAPDDAPPGGTGVSAEPGVAAEATTPPPVGDPPGFAADIAGLFRPHDRDEMLFRFDLASLDDVRSFAEPIHTRVQNGSMPCNPVDRWPPERVALFRRWIDGGMLP